jgi:diguanylate cyclase (GGDEF)-like protein
LRTRWNRAFTGFALLLVIGGVVTITGSQVLMSRYHHTADDLEAEAGLLAHLRSNIVPYAIRASSAHTAAPAQLELARLDSAVRKDFADGITTVRDPKARQQFRQGLAAWQLFVSRLHQVEQIPPSQQQQKALGSVISVGVPRVLAVLDNAGTASRAFARARLNANARVQNVMFAIAVTVFTLAVVLMLRLARRLSAEVLRPVGELRLSANKLAAGDLVHRVPVARDDEFGDLACSFNAMADAIAGSQLSLTRQATEDSLTALTNRAGFRARVEHALAKPTSPFGTQAVLFVDLDDFKDVNDVLGHAVGDELLRIVAGRLSQVVRPGDLVARLGGDEFAVLLDGVPDAAAAFALAERVVAALAAPAEVFGHRVQVGASIGVTMRQAGSDLDSLMREADVAMYSAKGHGKNRVAGYDVRVHDAVVEQHALGKEVGTAVQRQELIVEYQPVVDLGSGALVGVEALVRWQHPARGLLPPSAFIRLAEDTGAIVGIGTWVLHEAAQQMRRWQRRHDCPQLQMSVNVSVRQLEVAGFAEQVAQTLATTGLAPDCLVLEVTESVLADPDGIAAAELEKLRQLGVRIALDDFGTGYSSIGYLRQLPIDVLKIDRSFVSGPTVTGSGVALLEAIVNLGQRLGLQVIPEGIDCVEDLHRLQALGCTTGQGFLLSRPVGPAEIDVWLRLPGRGLPLPRAGRSAAVSGAHGRPVPVAPLSVA